MFSENFYLDIEKIHIAHEFILDRVQRCEYPQGRGHYGFVYVLNGKAEYRFFAGDRITVTDGDALFLSPNCAYSIVTEKEFKHTAVLFYLPRVNFGGTAKTRNAPKPSGRSGIGACACIPPRICTTGKVRESSFPRS